MVIMRFKPTLIRAPWKTPLTCTLRISWTVIARLGWKLNSTTLTTRRNKQSPAACTSIISKLWKTFKMMLWWPNSATSQTCSQTILRSTVKTNRIVVETNCTFLIVGSLSGKEKTLGKVKHSGSGFQTMSTKRRLKSLISKIENHSCLDRRKILTTTILLTISGTLTIFSFIQL